MDWNAVVTGACCLATLVLTAFGVVIWWQFRESVRVGNQNMAIVATQAIEIAKMQAHIESIKETRRDDLTAINRRQDEIIVKLNEMEAMFTRHFMHRRASDSDSERRKI